MGSGIQGGSPYRTQALILGVAAMVLCGAAAPAGPAAGAPVAASRASTPDRRAALRSVRDLIAAHYVFDDLREPLAAAIDASEAAGRYAVEDPDQFASRVTEDLQRVSHDGHLYLRRDAARYAAMTSPPEDDNAALEALQRTRALQRNHGLVEMSVRPENIRYIRLTNFDWVADGSTARAYERAEAFLADGHAVILDLRGNGGGQSEAADAFSSRLLGIGGPGGEPRRPVFLLVDGDTGSAAEAVAYDAQVRGAAVLVGARTYGAANNVRHYPIAPDLILSLSYNRPVHPITGANWEGVGVTPDIVTKPGVALAAAELEALNRLAGPLPEASPARAGYDWRAAALRAELEPQVVDPGTLERFAGRYGAIEIRLEDGALKLYRPDRPRWPQGASLKPMAEAGLFSMEGTDEVRFRFVEGALQILRPRAAPEPFGRTAEPE